MLYPRLSECQEGKHVQGCSLYIVYSISIIEIFYVSRGKNGGISTGFISEPTGDLVASVCSTREEVSPAYRRRRPLQQARLVWIGETWYCLLSQIVQVVLRGWSSMRADRPPHQADHGGFQKRGECEGSSLLSFSTSATTHRYFFD